MKTREWSVESFILILREQLSPPDCRQNWKLKMKVRNQSLGDDFSEAWNLSLSFGYQTPEGLQGGLVNRQCITKYCAVVCNRKQPPKGKNIGRNSLGPISKDRYWWPVVTELCSQIIFWNSPICNHLWAYHSFKPSSSRKNKFNIKSRCRFHLGFSLMPGS